MREIKFRAWDKENKKMLPLEDMIFQKESFHSTKEFKHLRYKVDFREDFWRDLQCKFEIMQYTGLKDENGVEIYEGDIVKYKTFARTVVGEVIYDDDFALFTIDGEGAAMDWQWSGIVDGKEIVHCEKEVIGNIYENPELLAD